MNLQTRSTSFAATTAMMLLCVSLTLGTPASADSNLTTHPVFDIDGLVTPGKNLTDPIPLPPAETPPVNTTDYPGTSPVGTPNVPPTNPITTPPVAINIGNITVRPAGSDVCVDIVIGAVTRDGNCVGMEGLGPVAALIPYGTTPLVYYNPDDVPGTPGYEVPDVPETQPQPIPDVPSNPAGSLGTVPGQDLDSYTVYIEATYTYDSSRLSRRAAIDCDSQNENCLAELYAPFGIGDSNWFASDGEACVFTVRAKIYENDTHVGTHEINIPYLGQLWGAAMYNLAAAQS